MDFFNELYLSALISILLAFLLGKFASASDTRSRPMNSAESVEPSQTVDRLRFEEEVSEIEADTEKEVEIERIEGFEDEEWEGIERSGIEGLFGEAMKFVAGEIGKEKVEKLGKEAQMRLYGLYKVAIEGPCYQSSQPMAIKISSRARWNAWQKLGDMNPEIAMERYVALLSEYIPDWNESNISKLESSSDFLQNQDSNIPSESSIENSSSEATNINQIQSKQGLTSTVLLNLLSPTRMTFLTSLYI